MQVGVGAVDARIEYRDDRAAPSGRWCPADLLEMRLLGRPRIEVATSGADAIRFDVQDPGQAAEPLQGPPSRKANPVDGRPGEQ